MSENVLTLEDFIFLQAILPTSQSGGTVKWTTDGGETIKTGVVRRLTTTGGDWLRESDVRDGVVEITTTYGVGATISIPVRECMSMLKTGAMAVRA